MAGSGLHYEAWRGSVLDKVQYDPEVPLLPHSHREWDTVRSVHEQDSHEPIAKYKVQFGDKQEISAFCLFIVADRCFCLRTKSVVIVMKRGQSMTDHDSLGQPCESITRYPATYTPLFGNSR